MIGKKSINLHRGVPIEGRRYFPRQQADLLDKDFVLNEVFGSTDREKLFSKRDKIMCIGSCFAARLAIALKKSGCNVEYADTQSGLENTFSLREYIETEGVDCKLLVLTIGLSEVWKKDGKILYRGAADYSDAYCEQTSVEENLENLRAIVKATPKLILTLSPVPLNATFMDRSAVISDCVSKSTLRVAIDLLLRERPDVIYWPSYEFVKWIPPHNGVMTFGDKGDSRAVPFAVSKLIIQRFLDSYLNDD